MATTSLLLMASDNDKTMKPPPVPLCGGGSSEEQPPKTTEPSTTRSGRGRKANNNGKGPKKQPQRGMGVAQLESILRNQEINGQIHRSSPSSSSVITSPLLSPPSFPVVNEPFAGNLPLHYATPSNHGPLHCSPPPPLMFNGNVVIPGGSGHQGPNVVGTATAVYHAGFNVLGGGFGPPTWNPLVGCPLETSRELSSMPNPHSGSHPCDLCFKKKRFTDNNNNNIARGSNTRRDNNTALDVWSSMILGSPDHFMGFPPQQAPNLTPETTDFTNRMSTHNNAHSYHHNLDESVGVVAVHRKTMSGKIVKEYEFFPGKEELRGTTFKELGLSLVGSSSSITATVASARAHRINADTTATATAAASSNSVDLSLRL
ncbi:hypothetical protein QN277_008683 [Acacia crassicarpa]|uniref:Uncharacterized protein n=1 Tax=Acacia crassicarpa TaxID=499986 RepID=A0AAE1ITU8_9FABA|nr:hypothetical protein QN277_008683 [Acacia crassicarpa]